MSTMIHQTAIVSKKALIGENVKIGAFSIIEDDVEIGDGTEIANNVYLSNGARIGKDCRIFSGVVVATEPQDLKFGGEKTLAIVGDRTVLREYATVNRGTKETGKTVVGKDCLLMAYIHVAHDCVLGDNIIMANAVQLAGHTHIEDWVIIGGVVKVHQFSNIGCHAMVGADVKVVKDVPPYTLVGDNPPKIDGINKIGLRRRGFSAQQIAEIEEFYKIINHSGMNISDGLVKYKERAEISDLMQHCINFIESSKRGVYR